MAIQNLNQGNLSIATNGVINTAEKIAGVNKTASGDANRNWLGAWSNATEIAREDWERAEQSANNQLQRDLYLTEQAQKWQEKMSNTSYQRAAEDLKKAGLNPILAYENGGASTPTASGSSSGGSRVTGQGYVANAGSIVSSIGMLLMGAGSLSKGVLSALPKRKIGF